ncbi:hypothetical protein [Paraburkholderia sp. RAU2J]|uniref:hypothetical protein n=1 Tax=Paraburkholderia sp. RAU2J TaxID=1938810 RepID=UPI0018F627C7|nr:hypothetical protein [Paraburkholderia sp. RAU2J]
MRRKVMQGDRPAIAFWHGRIARQQTLNWLIKRDFARPDHVRQQDRRIDLRD